LFSNNTFYFKIVHLLPTSFLVTVQNKTTHENTKFWPLMSPKTSLSKLALGTLASPVTTVQRSTGTSAQPCHSLALFKQQWVKTQGSPLSVCQASHDDVASKPSRQITCSNKR